MAFGRVDVLWDNSAEVSFRCNQVLFSGVSHLLLKAVCVRILSPVLSPRSR